MEAGRVSSPAGAATVDCRWLRCTIVISLCGQGISCPSFLCLVDGVAFYHLILGRKKAGDLFQISCSVCHCVSGGYLVVKVRDKLTRCKANKLELHQNNLRQQRCPTCDFFLYCGNSFLNGISGRIYNIRFIYSQIAKLLPHGFYQFDICLSV